MRPTPEVLPMLRLRSCQLTLLMSLAFGAVLAVFSAPLTAQTTQKSPGIPDLSGYDSETRHGDGYSKPARDSLKKLIEKPAGR
jgi:hypothetical protein